MLILENLFLSFFHYLIIFSSYELNLHQSLQIHFHLGFNFYSKSPLTLFDFSYLLIKKILNQIFSFFFLIVIGKINFLRFCKYDIIVIIITLFIKWSHTTSLAFSRKLNLWIVIFYSFMPLNYTFLFTKLFKTFITYFFLNILILLLIIIKRFRLFFLLWI